jgi:uncharacterized repeat protein (TIGR03803 family)
MKKLSLKKIACIVVMLSAVSGVAALAQTFTTLARFGAGNGGAPPQGPLAQGLNGDFYGTAAGGGGYTYGTIFEMTPGGELILLDTFCPFGKSCYFPGPNGGNPSAGLTLGTDGDLYGASMRDHGGTIFKIDDEGTYTELYGFCSQANCADGRTPQAGPIQASDGNFYGTTSAGGANVNASFCPEGCGTIFEMTPEGKLTTLYSFCSQPACADGDSPVAALIQATDGNFYGTTEFGGAYGGVDTGGTVFEITPTGAFTTLYSFCSLPNCADGAYPPSPLIQATDGNFYGTTEFGGAYGSINTGGTVFEITPAGKLTTLYSFCSQSGCTDGAQPDGGLLQATDGNFYGTTEFGGANTYSDVCAIGCGTLFQITPTGTLTTLHSFCADMSQPGRCTDGDLPTTSLVQATHGGIYGTTFHGGLTVHGQNNCCGTVFFLSMGLGPFVETVRRSGEVGGTVTILGNDLGRTSSVAFNGTAAAFTVVSSTEITATVPTGATTGFVTVTTPIATLTSNKKFRIEP